MRIEITGDGVKKEEKIILTNDSLDNYNFVDIVTKDNEITVDIEELFSAVLAFHTLKRMNKERE